MNYKPYCRKIILFSFLSFFYLTAYAQSLLESRQSSPYTYIYKIKDQEAKQIYAKNKWKVNPSFFHTLVDSFPTYSKYTKKLPKGHYIKTYAEKNKQKLSITTVQDFEVFIFNNNTDLCIQVYDLEGNIINDAAAKIRGKKLRFKNKAQSFIHKKSNQKGLLEIKHDDFTAYYNLKRDYNNSFIKRGFRKVLYSKPIKYVWLPVEFVILLPVDGVKSIVKGWPQGKVYQGKNFFVKFYKKVACLFDNYYCDSRYKFKNKHTGYLVFNKPKYMPGDTVKFKAFLTTKKGKPINKVVKVVLQNRGKKIEITTLKPYRKGVYAFEFYLHDSLQLKLDQHFGISLQLTPRKEYISAYFKYEYYELKKNTIALRLDDEVHYKDKDINLFIKGTDENDLNLFDARLEVLIHQKKVFKYFEKEVFIPDTLLFLRQKLDPTDETKIVLSDSLFPKANFEYVINVRLLTTDNEAISKSHKMVYLYETKNIDFELIQDSIHIDYSKNGQKETKKINVESIDNFGNKTEIHKGFTPYKFEINPYFSSYKVTTDSLSKYIILSQESSLLEIYSERTHDSIYIVVDNPRKIPFHYNIYKKSKQKALGYTDSLKYFKQTNSKQNYFLSIRYLWGGKVTEENYEIPFVDKKLNISVTQPKVVYPGQKTKIEVVVTDTKGIPVEGVDLTAYSYTKKFDHLAPEVPYLGKKRKSKTLINNFRFDNIKKKKHPDLYIDYNLWRKRVNLDTIEYYKFSYPNDNIYRSTYYPKDSITQFAPFVFSNGKPTPVHVVYVDNKPTYFSWSTNTQAYSFKIDSGYHQIKLRTSFREIVIDSLYLEQGKKTFFSIDQNSKNPLIKVKEVNDRLSDAEKRNLYKYIVPYKDNFKGQYAFIEQDENIHFLKSTNNSRNNLAGPLVGEMTFQLLDSFSTTFQHDPFYQYLFKPGLLKMRNIERRKYPDFLTHKTKQGLRDEVLTLKSLEKQWSEYLDVKRYKTARYKNPMLTVGEKGRLSFKLLTSDKLARKKPLNILMFKNDDHGFLRVYPGKSRTIHGLEEGYYKLIFLYPEEKYQVEDSIYIRINGLNYYAFDEPNILPKDSFSIEVNQIIENTLFKPKAFESEAKIEMNRIQNQHREKFKYSGVGKIMDGYIYDDEGLALIGANVLIKGTTFGTITDIDGYYTINVPPGYNTLVVSYIGYSTIENEVGFSNTLNLTLNESASLLNEVVVTGYGIKSKSVSLVARSTTASTGNLMGKMPGVNGQTLSGKATGIMITPGNGNYKGSTQIMVRGMTSTFENTPLYIINGNVFTGDISQLSSKDIDDIEILKDANAVSIYGSRAANGVVIISTNPGSFKPTRHISKTTELDDLFYESARQSSSIRDNFSDYAFWQPSLITNKEGKASFEVVFPDDITSWDTHYLAMGRKRQSGQTKGNIKSYKPLVAQLAIPRFLVQGDTTYAIGKALNYLPDSTEVETKFEVGNVTISNDKRFCSTALIDTATIIASMDSLAIKYYLEAKDGYLDGEKRMLPVFKRGLEKTKGAFYNLDKDTTFSVQFDSKLGEAMIYARADIIHIFDDEIRHLIKYKYACNEQLASKLKALIAAKSIAKFRNKKFKYDKKIEKIIRQLEKNQNEIGLWGWWKKSKENLWISLHVLEALFQAEKNGYKIAIDKTQITESLTWESENSENFNKRMRMLKILMLTNSKANYKTHVDDLEKIMDKSLNELLHLIELKQQLNLNYNLDTLSHFRKTSLLGNTYYSDKNQEKNLLNNDIQNTLLVYKILKKDSTVNENTFRKITNYILEKRRNGYWRNTYESARILDTILSDILKNKESLEKPALFLKGDINMVIQKFPFELKADPNKSIEVSKSGDYPIYLTTYQKYWDPHPALKTRDFEISTNFENKSTSFLEAGKETKLITKVSIKKDAEYVMINIPIPGGCSYSNKDNNFRFESHREYFKNETAIFCSYLPAGEYTFEIDLIPRYSGTYTINPAKIELMYFPTFNANNELKTVKIQ